MNKKKTLSKLFIVIFAVVSIFVAIKCREVIIKNTTEIEPSTTITITLNDFSYTIDPRNDGAVICPGTLNCDRYNTVSIDKYVGFDIFINDQPLIPENEVKLFLAELSSENQIVVKMVEQEGNITRYCYFNTIPDNYTNPPVFANNPDFGYYYFNLNEYVYKMNTAGNVVFWRLAGRGDISCGGDDFKMTKVNGKKYYSFLYGNETMESPFLKGVGYGRMQGIVLDEDYKVIDNVQFLELEDEEKIPLENHQFTVLGEKHYLLTSYVGKRVNNIPDTVPHGACGTRVVAAVIQEVKDGNVVFEWDSTDYPELYELSTAGNDYYNITGFWADYAHLNSVVLDSNQDFICSFRNLDTVLKIDRATKQIAWKLGGLGDEFGLEENQKFSKQHDARITSDNSITIFNNGNEGNSFSDGNTSALKITIDENSKQLLKYQKFQLEGQFSSHMGSVQETGESRFVIGWGGRQTSSPLFSEIDFKTGQVLFEVLSPRDGGAFPDVYKVYKFDE